MTDTTVKYANREYSLASQNQSVHFLTLAYWGQIQEKDKAQYMKRESIHN
jgi:hypothetical protein